MYVDRRSILEKLTGMIVMQLKLKARAMEGFSGSRLETVCSELCIVESDKLWIGNSKL